MRRIHVFRAGKHTPMAGPALEFSAADLSAVAAGYDPARHEAPIVVGHPQLDAPAYGWVGALAVEDGNLFAEPIQVEPQFAQLVQDGRFKKVSASFFAPTHPRNPTPGQFYLKHVGFLGATPPAVQGLKSIAFAADDDQVVTVEFAEVGGWRLGWLLSDISSLFRGVRDHLVGTLGAEATEKLLPGDRVQRIAEEGARLQAEGAAAASPAPGFAGDPPQPKESKVTENPAGPTPEELAARERALAEREASFAAREAEARRTADQAFVDGLVASAQLPQGLAPRVVAFMASIGGEGEVSFAGADGKPVKQAPREAFRGILSGLPKLVKLGKGEGEEAPAFAEGDSPDAIVQASIAYQRQQKARGVDVDDVEAIRAVTGGAR